MSGESITITADTSALDRLQDQLRKLSAWQSSNLLDNVGAIVESQTRRRISDEKTAPDGTSWAPWSERYAKTRNANQSLLVSQGYMLDTLLHQSVGRSDVEIGSNKVYAPTHQAGSSRIPERPFLGLSRSNEDEVVSVVEDWLAGVVK